MTLVSLSPHICSATMLILLMVEKKFRSLVTSSSMIFISSFKKTVWTGQIYSRTGSRFISFRVSLLLSEIMGIN